MDLPTGATANSTSLPSTTDPVLGDIGQALTPGSRQAVPGAGPVLPAVSPTLPSGGEWVRLLDVDPDLAEGLSPDVFERARRLLRAPVVTLERHAPKPPDCDPGTNFGLLVLSGLMGRRIRLGHAYATELLGPGDILRPWDEQELLESVPPQVDWRIFGSVRLAVLDQEVTRLIGRRPELMIAFSGRLLNRARSGSYMRAVSHLARVDEKVLITLWHLATRWGHVTPTGVVIPFRLTHEVFGEILGAQRPSVTIALNRLRRNGTIARGSDGRLVLLGSPSDCQVPAPAPPAMKNEPLP